MTHKHGSLSVGSCAFEKLVAAFGAGSSECALFSTCITRADFVIKMILNEVCQGRRRLQRGECISCIISESTQRMMEMEIQSQQTTISISMLLVLPPLFPQRYILAAQKGNRSCQMTSNVNLHINIIAIVPCTLDRKGLHLLREEDVRTKSL